jgi:ubiquinone/menaquinone biosynthesis C-methylase UbiE
MTAPRVDYDSELRALHPHLRAAARVGRGERVLDIGCGAGESTRDAGRSAAPGPVLGIDVDEQLLDRARRLTAAEGLDNVTYVRGDAQVHPFPDESYDVAISRFGTMFFADPVAAFTNIGRALRPRARLVLLVWQARERNEWASVIDGALCGASRPPVPARASDPFSLGDTATVRGILDHAGFREIRLDEVRAPVFYGDDSAAALAFVRAFHSTREALATMAPDDADRALERLRQALDEHRTADDGVALDSRAWIITARR